MSMKKKIFFSSLALISASFSACSVLEADNPVPNSNDFESNIVVHNDNNVGFKTLSNSYGITMTNDLPKDYSTVKVGQAFTWSTSFRNDSLNDYYDLYAKRAFSEKQAFAVNSQVNAPASAVFKKGNILTVNVRGLVNKEGEARETWSIWAKKKGSSKIERIYSFYFKYLNAKK